MQNQRKGVKQSENFLILHEITLKQLNSVNVFFLADSP